MLNLHGGVMKGHSRHVQLYCLVPRLPILILIAVTASSHTPHQAVLLLPSQQNVDKHSRQVAGVSTVSAWAMLHENASPPFGATGAGKNITHQSVTQILTMLGTLALQNLV
jgi:hypothetical protein